MSNTPRPKAAQLGALGFFAITLVCAAGAAYLAGKMISAKGYTNDKLRPVVVAKHPLPAAQVITEADLDVVNWPEKHVPAGAFPDVKAVFVDNKTPVPTMAILEGEPVVPARLASSSQGTGLAALVRDGYRAVAVKCDESVGRSGLVYPGAHVDVLATIRDPEGRGASTKLAVSDVRVLAVEAETSFQTRRPRQEGDDRSLTAAPASYTGTVVTVEVTPEDAEIVSLANREGSLDLALRNGSDHAPVQTNGATPAVFSAFEVTVDASNPPAAASPTDKNIKPKPAGRTINLRANDRPTGNDHGDHPTTGDIETYHAH